MYFNYVKDKEDLEKIIYTLAEDLKRRASDITNDWDKNIARINLYATISPGEILQWDITKTYSVIGDNNE